MITGLIIAQGCGMASALALMIKAGVRPKDAADWIGWAVAVIIWPIMVSAMVQGIRDRLRRQRQFRRAKARIEPMPPASIHYHGRARDDTQ